MEHAPRPGLTHNRHGLLRVPWRIALYVGFLIASGAAVGAIAGTDGRHASSALFAILGYAVMTLLLLLSGALGARFLDRRPAASLGLGFHARWWRELLGGMALGIAFVSAVVALLVVAGALRLEPAGLPTGAIVRGLLFHLALFTGVGFFEELLFRGYLLQALAEGLGDTIAYVRGGFRAGAGTDAAAGRAGKILAAVVLSAPFGVAHLFNDGGTIVGALGTGLAGLLLSLAYFRTRALWLPVGLHITWNLFLGWVYSVPVSGETLESTPFAATLAGPEWLTGGTFGPEAGVPALAGIALMAWLIGRSRRFAPSDRAIEWFPPQERRGSPVPPVAVS